MTTADTPSIADVLEALRGFGQSYHDLHLAVQGSADEGRKDRREILRRVDLLFGELERLQQQIDRRFTRAWAEIDALRESLDARPPLDEVARIIAQVERNKADIVTLKARLGMGDDAE